MQHRGFTVLFTGLSGAGKSTLSHAFADRLRECGQPAEVLDGDEFRATICSDLGFSKQDRQMNLRRIAVVARLLSRNGIVAIVAAIAPYRESRDEFARMQQAPCFEVFVDCDISELIRRDTKSYYRHALSGQLPAFTGISDVYEEPSAPDLHLHTDRQSIQDAIADVTGFVERRGLLVARDTEVDANGRTPEGATLREKERWRAG